MISGWRAEKCHHQNSVSAVVYTDSHTKCTPFTEHNYTSNRDKNGEDNANRTKASYNILFWR